MSLPRYEEYKDSGVPWLGLVPKHWRVSPIKAFGQLKAGAGFPHEEQGLQGQELDFFKVGSLSLADSKGILQPGEHTITRATASRLGAFIFPPRSITFAKVGAALMLGRIREIPKPACIDNNMMALMVSAPNDHVYVRYAMELVRFDLIANPGAVPSLNEGQVGNFVLCAPPSTEQTAIAAFLDRETGKIDALIAEQEKLLALLAEKRQATISHAVTKGLNPDAPMKDSGVVWLGEVPEKWQIGKIQNFAKRESGHTPSRQHPEWWENCKIPWFSLADVWQLRAGNTKYVYETKELISELGLENSSARLLPAGTVMLSRTASVGYSAIMGCDMATTQDFINWVCKPELTPDFLLYVLRAMKCEFERLMMGSTHQTIYMPDVAKLIMGLPPINEQAEIVSFLDTKIANFDELIATSERAIELLKERRSALISAAVTGQIDVRGAVPEPEAA